MHQRYGKLPWKDLFEAAIAYAEQGFPVTEAIQEQWARHARSSADPESARVFLPGGKPPLQGDLFRNPDWPAPIVCWPNKGPMPSTRARSPRPF